ncbi:YbaB/EbfC family nucleoid-associated protein [Saccharopolyspora sp. TS4A08]|uniref:YbaB/EbfC family nucleoid-associated protein n=1 Tax=Saccharopolyspora ipomoeae TaxID=3042027 RepID=A0ABT6PU74_9PSEU|nr:YbaB/EbfC family nucleoid-associated protein [Saccharopolyspora sp. TS4A08]MDI2031528.1 YbaB/EbfC family nucleoid-associated protein [Saccharopolyspora sp. TS4A08]
MTGPDGRKAELEARNAAMREQVSSMLDGLQRQTAQLREAQASALAATGEATSSDGLVTVRVNAAGVVTDTALSPSALRTSAPEKLARSFTEAAQSAARDARARADAAVAPLQENVPDLPDLFPDAPSLAQLIPAAPELPEPNTPSSASKAPVEEDWDDFEPRSRFRKDRW